MVNLLLVSHSKKLADGAAELLRQMAPSESLKIGVAAGIGDNHQELGTNALEILESLQQLAQPDGVLVLMDLGSAVLSAQMALDMLEEELRPKVALCPAPFIEGAIAAGVQANVGSDLQGVYAEAMQALRAKQEQLHAAPVETPESPSTASTETASETIHLTLVVPNAAGLHARPAALFTRAIAGRRARVRVTNASGKNTPVLITGLITVMLLGAKQGDVLQIDAEGPERELVIEDLRTLFANNFGEEK